MEWGHVGRPTLSAPRSILYSILRGIFTAFCTAFCTSFYTAFYTAIYRALYTARGYPVGPRRRRAACSLNSAMCASFYNKHHFYNSLRVILQSIEHRNRITVAPRYYARGAPLRDRSVPCTLQSTLLFTQHFTQRFTWHFYGAFYMAMCTAVVPRGHARGAPLQARPAAGAAQAGGGLRGGLLEQTIIVYSAICSLSLSLSLSLYIYIYIYIISIII
jgi:hypothetical protein